MISRRTATIGLAVVVLIVAVWVILAPAERSLGNGIRIVFLHAAAAWVGMLGIYAAGLIGLTLVVRPRQNLESWLRSVGWVGLGLFGGGFLLSLVSAQISWGGVLWQEPRLQASIQVLLVGLLVQAGMHGPFGLRAKGAAWLLMALVAGWVVQSAELFFHPEQPIESSTSGGIRAAFYGISALTFAAGVLLVRVIHRGENS